MKPKQPKPEMKTWRLFWTPEGKPIGVVRAATASLAIRQARQPYRKYLGEIRAEEIKDGEPRSLYPPPDPRDTSLNHH